MRHSCKFALIVHWNAKIQAPSCKFHIKIQASVSRFSAKFQDSHQDAKGRHSALRKLTVLLGMVAAFALCAELESRACAVASELLETQNP